MATLLELVNHTERESGTVSQTSRLSTVVGATGRQEKIVQHVIEAWRLIQSERTDWAWMRRTATLDLTIDQLTYGPADFVPAISNFGRWERGADRRHRSPFSIYDDTIGRADESELFWLPYDDWSRQYDFGSHDANRPRYFSVAPDRKLCVGPKPDKEYKLRSAYWLRPQILAADADEPICPLEHHMIIVWRALMLLAGHDEATFSLADAQAKYAACFRALANDRDDYMEP
ncbi:phage adaptor protein [Sphingopyxis flava]|uniref:Uncharacterized protein n=1 Tax=Sphingopyxis flava TaxID=1507287 RepID=A0A1T5AC80_9SPHN|nr:hypothetical protein [Sphingopyxis flava]SKB32377.1 hypothetical protein SAMN06295937_100373 [Sphingopyxis flava]